MNRMLPTPLWPRSFFLVTKQPTLPGIQTIVFGENSVMMCADNQLVDRMETIEMWCK